MALEGHKRPHRRHRGTTRPSNADTAWRQGAREGMEVKVVAVTAGVVMESKREGTCERCPEPILVGQQIRYVPPVRGTRRRKGRPARAYHLACAEGSS